jgi:hypothetical protein
LELTFHGFDFNDGRSNLMIFPHVENLLGNRVSSLASGHMAGQVFVDADVFLGRLRGDSDEGASVDRTLGKDGGCSFREAKVWILIDRVLVGGAGWL